MRSGSKETFGVVCQLCPYRYILKIGVWQVLEHHSAQRCLARLARTSQRNDGKIAECLIYGRT